MFIVKSKSTSSYFGKYKSKAAADMDAAAANEEQKNGVGDWESEEKPEKAETACVISDQLSSCFTQPGTNENVSKSGCISMNVVSIPFDSGSMIV